MNEEVKRMWIQALRSGEFAQGATFLRSRWGHGYSCLGVLTELYRRMTGQGEWREEAVDEDWYEDRDLLDTGLYWLFDDGSETQDRVLTAKVAQWAGLKDRTGEYKFEVFLVGCFMFSSLQTDNDIGRSFHELARIIEAKF